MTASNDNPKNHTAPDTAPSNESRVSAKRLITAKDITTAVDNQQAAIALAPGGILTPLARDLARDYAIKIIKA